MDIATLLLNITIHAREYEPAFFRSEPEIVERERNTSTREVAWPARRESTQQVPFTRARVFFSRDYP